MDLRERIEQKMDELQKYMETNKHLENSTEVWEHIESLLIYWNVLDEQDRDYIQCAQYAIEEQKEWKI